MPATLSQIILVEKQFEEHLTPEKKGRLKIPGKHAMSPYTQDFDCGCSSSVGPPIFPIKHPFTHVIRIVVDPNLIEEFREWLYDGIHKRSSRRKSPYPVEVNKLERPFDLGVERVDKKEWFYNLAHAGQVLNDTVC
nr:uncharacterized protein LOC104091389 [Nicotiana tomentosiformis]